MAEQIKKKTERFEKLLARLSSGHNPRRRLSIRETAQGLTACYLNGLALLEDARLVAANGREQRALSLTILALEELAKVPDLYDQYVDPTTRNNGTAWGDFWKRWSQQGEGTDATSNDGKPQRRQKAVDFTKRTRRLLKASMKFGSATLG